MKKYSYIAQTIKKQINQGKLQEGHRLLSIIQASQFYQCSKGTVQRAYQQLIEEHYIYVKKQSGFFVAKPFHLSKLPEKLINLSTGNTLVNTFPLHEAQTSLVQALSTYQYQTLNYEQNGILSLRTALKEHLAEKGILTSEKSLYINQGIHQAFVALCHSLNKEKHYILVENPTYSYTLLFLKSHTIPVKTIQRTATGIDLKKLEAYFKYESIRFFYIVPKAHNPLGTDLSKKTIRKIAELAKKYNVLIIENDYFLEGHPTSEQETIFENAREHCLYLSSFTKVLPYLRIGFMLVPNSLTTTVEKMVRYYYTEGYFAPAMISQASLEVILKNKLISRYSAQLAQEVKEKKQLVLACSQQWESSIAEIIPGDSGFYSLVRLHPNISITLLQEQLLKKNIAISTSQEYFYGAHPDSHSIRISISQIPLDIIPNVLATIYKLCAKLSKTNHYKKNKKNISY